MQQNELTESFVYEKIAKFAKGDENKKVLLRLSAEEKAHYEIWKKYTGIEMKPNKFSPAHNMSTLAELVCSNSLRSNQLNNAVGLLKEELKLQMALEFLGDNAGLVVAEVELGSIDEVFEKPAFLGKEVTGDKRYYNSSLTRVPFKCW